jgi:hypothetical protein
MAEPSMRDNQSNVPKSKSIDLVYKPSDQVVEILARQKRINSGQWSIDESDLDSIALDEALEYVVDYVR